MLGFGVYILSGEPVGNSPCLAFRWLGLSNKTDQASLLEELHKELAITSAASVFSKVSQQVALRGRFWTSCPSVEIAQDNDLTFLGVQSGLGCQGDESFFPLRKQLLLLWHVDAAQEKVPVAGIPCHFDQSCLGVWSSGPDESKGVVKGTKWRATRNRTSPSLDMKLL